MSDEHTHQWSEWIAYDAYVMELGIAKGFQYHRECMILGCGVRQRTHDLIPVGEVENF
jgi:hypothetical protein